MKKLFYLSIILIISYIAIAAPTDAQSDRSRRGRMGGQSGFIYDVYYFRSATNPSQTTVRLYATFSNDILQFVKESNFRFHAKYEFMFAIFDNNGNQIGGKSITDDIFVRNFVQTNLRTLSNIVDFVTDVDPGDYKLVMELTDLDTKHSSKQSHRLVVKNFPSDKLSVSDIMISDYIQPNSTTIETIVPNLENNILSPDIPYGALVDIYPFTSDQPVTISYEVMEFGTENVVISDEETVMPTGMEPIEKLIILQNRLSRVMRYNLIVKVNQNNQDAVSERPFMSSWRYTDTNDLTIEQSLEPMKHLVKHREWNWVQDADDSTKRVWFDNFWKQRDPTPDTPENELKKEYFLRVAYVSKNFAVPNYQKAGWDTDRGKIYLKYGAPSNIEHRARGINNPSYEVWSYNTIQRRFIFEDRSDFGDYRLVKVE